MRILAFVALTLTLTIALPAQSVVDTLGGTTSSPNRAALAKANLVRVDKTVLLLNQEWYLTINGPETLTFFRYRYHSQNGTYKLDWTQKVKVTGNGAGWYALGINPMVLVEGNYYMLGVSWTGTVTYNYSIGTSGSKISFGAWIRGVTPTGLPSTYNIGGLDRAEYNQRLTTVPTTVVSIVGKPCGTTRLTTGTRPTVGQTATIDLLDPTNPSAPGVVLMTATPLLPMPLKVFGCDLHLNPGGLVFAFPVALTGGAGSVALPIPGDPWLSGLQLNWQGATANKTGLFLSNALQTTL